jgi:hypothetical protein
MTTVGAPTNECFYHLHQRAAAANRRVSIEITELARA